MISTNRHVFAATATMLLGLALVVPMSSFSAAYPAAYPTEEKAARGPAGAEMDPVTKALYQALDERARSQSDFERNEAAGRPKENGTKKQLRIELGDELGGGVYSNDRRERFAVRQQERDKESEIPTIESKLDAESREVRSQIRNERSENRRRAKSSRRGHWIDE
ncbi:MAG: hypothetical protein J0L82_15015 [Deltaproteobacteria bacterium]|nr:hypothetical protein [Deltaproteobacteria bacterium]